MSDPAGDQAASEDGSQPARSTRRSTDAGPRTRGGWTPAGTAAERRAVNATGGYDRGKRTRRLLIDAARRVFEQHGYLQVGVDEIVAEAGVARGTFYTYFPSKREVFREVTLEVGQVMDAALITGPDDERLDPVDALARSNLRYMTAFREHARIYSLAEQVAHIDEENNRLLTERRRRDVDRIAGTIRRWQARGVADPDVQPAPTAAALLSMTRHLCYWLYVGGDNAYSEADAAQALNDIWVRAVDLRRRPRRLWLQRQAEQDA